MVNPIFYILTGAPTVVATVLSLLIYRELNDNSEAAMASFQLKQEAAMKDFEILTVGVIPMITGGVLYSLGGYLEMSLLRNLGYLSGCTFSYALMFSLYRWRRRF